ncbi:hypothetical protein NO1_1449 [Candidatus Termititenax aidoneus]|uniref:Uncharacterized protein n=1 Tax=Termititenax aidoneus TaxID=2218524 RepID=A0A388TBT1_TERA1|nr:hypothetical protein NO1_1449 [Candidatus Termititenax aidoneus]
MKVDLLNKFLQQTKTAYDIDIGGKFMQTKQISSPQKQESVITVKNFTPQILAVELKKHPTDREFALLVAGTYPHLLIRHGDTNTWNNDSEIVLRAMKRAKELRHYYASEAWIQEAMPDDLYYSIGENLCNDARFILKFAKYSLPDAVNKLGKELRKNQNFMLHLIKLFPDEAAMIVNNAHKKLKHSKKFLLAVLEINIDTDLTNILNEEDYAELLVISGKHNLNDFEDEANDYN